MGSGGAVGARQLSGRRAKRVGVCFVDGGGGAGRHRQHIVFQKSFPGAARTELESQLQRAVKVSVKGKHVKCKMDLERCLVAVICSLKMPRLLELFCGAKLVGRAFEAAGWEVVSLDIVSKFEPTILCDIRSWDYTTFLGTSTWSGPVRSARNTAAR